MSDNQCQNVRIAVGRPEDRSKIFQIRHDVYAVELRQHQSTQERMLHDTLDEFNEYITANVNGHLVGFVSITPPGFGKYSIDKYIPRDVLPFYSHDDLYEIRILTVAKEYRRSRLAAVLMYAAFRWVEENNGKKIVAIGRSDLMGMYLRVGMQPLNHRIKAGEVFYELLTAEIEKLSMVVKANFQLLDRLRREVIWDMEFPFFKAEHCFHGGAFFNAIGTGFETLERRNSVVNADVLDAWFPPSKNVLDTLYQHLPWLLSTSPPTLSDGMRTAIARFRGVEAESILPGAGSSDLIYLAFRHWLNEDSRVLILDPMYGEYSHVLENVVGCQVERLVLQRSKQYILDLDELHTRARKAYDLIILVNPNSPTGQHIHREDLEKIVAKIPTSTRVWLDETYIEYVGANESLEHLASRSKNVIICKSMSKVYALSGVRAAYLCASRNQLSDLVPLCPPWSVSLPAQVAAVRALQDEGYYLKRYQETHELRAKLIEGLRNIGIREIIDGRANFVLCHLEEGHPTAAVVIEECQKCGVFLRDASSMGTKLGPRSLRISVKDAETNEIIVKTLRRALVGTGSRN
jgi:histidinol-phosphate/aromatic aminotransferase/cobyric acid decarboxylase-like protein/predicted GNAT family N-acyltransferase